VGRLQSKKLSEEAKEAGIISDQVICLGSSSKRNELKQNVRLIRILFIPSPRSKKRRSKATGKPKEMLIATNLMDLPAETIGLIYRQRWMVELFFRFFKHVLGCRHLLSHRKNGIKIQVYMAIIVCLLIALRTGRKPTLRTVEMLRFYAIGWADEQEVQEHIDKLQTMDG
jgi:transposase